LQHQNFVRAVAFSPDGGTVLTGSDDETARLWNVRTGKPLTAPLQHQGAVLAVTFSPDGGTVLTGSDDETARLWNVRTGKPLTAPLEHQNSVVAVAFSPNGGTVLTGSYDETARLWDAQTGKPLTAPLQHQLKVLAVAFSPDGRTVLTGSLDNTARLWDAQTGKPLTASLEHQGPVGAVAFSPDGGIVATGSQSNSAFPASGDNTVRLWDAHTGKPLTAPLQLQDPVQSVAFSPNGKEFFVATDHWLNTYSWDGQEAVPQSSQLLHGFWKNGFRFPADCENCLQVALGDTGNSLRLETLHLDGLTDPPIEGDPKELLEKWKVRLGLKFDEQMRPVPR
jgi:WD40 repeat protein